MHTVFWDLETCSAAKLRECGAHVYVVDPTTQPLCLVCAIDNAEPQIWLPSDPPPSMFFEIAARPNEHQLIAHNFDFECTFYDAVLVARFGFPPIPLHVHHCTQGLALANSYPAELGLLAEALGLPYGKDPAARKAMLQVSRPRQQLKRKGKAADSAEPVFERDPAKLQLLFERCKTDVLATREVWRSPKLKHLSDAERRIQLLDAEINARGIRLDRAFTEQARDLTLRERAAINLRLQELTCGEITTVNQRDRFVRAINARGHTMSTLTKQAVAQVLAHKPDDYVRELLELRRKGARAAVAKFDRLLAYASPADDRMRGTLRMYGSSTGRWSGLGPQLQNLKKNESNLPLSVVDSIRTGDHAEIAKYGNPLALLGDISRAALCAGEGMELKSGDFSAIESVVLAWLAGEQWKLDAYRTFQRTGDAQLEPYRVIARKMLHKDENTEITPAERQLGKGGELAAGFGGSVGAWRRIVPNDPRTDDEIKAIILQWRNAHPATCKFWKDLARSIRVAIRTGQPVLVAEAPQPPIVAAFADDNLTLTLPSGRMITYPEARLVPGKFEEGPSDIEFLDNARGQWRRIRSWFGVFVENVVQATARDLLAAAIERFEACGINVVFHCHDEVTVEVPIRTLSDAAFLEILLEAPDWAKGLPLAGKVHSGPHYLAPPEEPAQPLATPDNAETALNLAIDSYIETGREGFAPTTPSDPTEARFYLRSVPAEEDAELAPLTALVTMPISSGNKVCCPFHVDPNPSCVIYSDHFHCYGCGAHGSRLNWLTQVEGMTLEEAGSCLLECPDAIEPAPQRDDSSDSVAFAEQVWASAQPLTGTIGARYLDETRGIDLSKLPANIHDSLRFHPSCVFGPGTYLPCLLALMRDPPSGATVGIQRTALVARNGRIEKVDRRMLGYAGVVKLWPASSQLVVGEGLESTLAAATRLTHNGAPLVPAWAALSTGKLRTLPPIPGVMRLILLVDNDANGEGQAAAAACAERWSRAGCEVVRLTPAEPDTDFNDVVMETA